jgi:uncharacterized protein
VNGRRTAAGVGTAGPRPVVHLELHTRDLAAARSLYAELLGWRSTTIATRDGSYVALDVGTDVGGGIVQCDTERAVWLPYVEVRHVDAVTTRARRLGADVLLAPREGPAGWRSVVATAEGGELALWQAKAAA